MPSTPEAACQRKSVRRAFRVTPDGAGYEAVGPALTRGLITRYAYSQSLFVPSSSVPEVSMRRAGVVMLPFLFVACANDPGGDVALVQGAVSQGANDEGTRLSVTGHEATNECVDEKTAAVTLDYKVVSTAAADSATVTASVDGGEPVVVGAIASGAEGWTFDGRTKTATGTADFKLENGEHKIVFCVTQSGANGRNPKTTCSEAVLVKVDCAKDDGEGDKDKCNQGLGNGSEGCDPGNSNNNQDSNDEDGDSRGNGNPNPRAP